MHTGKIVTTFKERFSDLCEKSPHNDTEIARELQVSKQTLSAWKYGTRSPKGPTIETIARYFDVSVDWLLGFDVPEQKEKLADQYDELDYIIAHILLKLSPEWKNVIMKLTPQDWDRMLDFAKGLLAARSVGSSAGL